MGANERRASAGRLQHTLQPALAGTCAVQPGLALGARYRRITGARRSSCTPPTSQHAAWANGAHMDLRWRHPALAPIHCSRRRRWRVSRPDAGAGGLGGVVFGVVFELPALCVWAGTTEQPASMTLVELSTHLVRTESTVSETV